MLTFHFLSFPLSLPPAPPLPLCLQFLSTPIHSPPLSTVPLLHPPLQKDLGYLQQWLKAFVGAFEKSISLSSLEPRR